MKHIIFILLLFIGTISVQASVPTPSAVFSFYNNMKKLAIASNDQESDDIARSMRKLSYAIQYGGSASGDMLRNDFQSFIYDEQQPFHNDVELQFELYTNKLEKYIYEDKVMNVEYNVLHSDYYGGAIDYNNGKKVNQTTIIETVVEKTYTIGYQTIAFRDTLLTHIPTNTICQFYNIKSDDKDILDLKKRAARFYYLERYEDAYKCFEKILVINPNEAETLYRLGLMTYYGEGCEKIYSKKMRFQKGKEFMERAYQTNITFGFKDKAKIVLHNWKYGHSLM